MNKYEKLYRKELKLLDDEISERIESAIASVEFETEDFTFKEKYEILREERDEGYLERHAISLRKTTDEQEKAFLEYIKHN